MGAAPAARWVGHHGTEPAVLAAPGVCPVLGEHWERWVCGAGSPSPGGSRGGGRHLLSPWQGWGRPCCSIPWHNALAVGTHQQGGTAGRPPHGKRIFLGQLRYRLSRFHLPAASLITKCKSIDSAAAGRPLPAARCPAAGVTFALSLAASTRASPTRNHALCRAEAVLERRRQGTGTSQGSAPADFGPVVPAAASLCRARLRTQFRTLLKPEHVSVPQFLF